MVCVSGMPATFDAGRVNCWLPTWMRRAGGHGGDLTGGQAVQRRFPGDLLAAPTGGQRQVPHQGFGAVAGDDLVGLHAEGVRHHGGGAGRRHGDAGGHGLTGQGVDLVDFESGRARRQQVIAGDGHAVDVRGRRDGARHQVARIAGVDNQEHWPAPACTSLTANWPLPRYTAWSLGAALSQVEEGVLRHDRGADDGRSEGIADVQHRERDIAGEAELRQIADRALPAAGAADDQGLVAVDGDGQRLHRAGDIQLAGHRQAGRVGRVDDQHVAGAALRVGSRRGAAGHVSDLAVDRHDIPLVAVAALGCGAVIEQDACQLGRPGCSGPRPTSRRTDR